MAISIERIDQLAIRLAKHISASRHGISDKANLQSYLLEYYSRSMRSKLDLNKAYTQVHAFISRSFLQLCKNYARDEESPFARQIQDTMQAIKRLKRLNFDERAICEELCICQRRLDYIQQLELTKYTAELTEWGLPASNADTIMHAQLACMSYEELDKLQDRFLQTSKN